MNKGALLIISAMLFASTSAQASTVLRNRLSIGGGFGASWPEWPTAFHNNYKDAQPVWTGNIGYGLTQDTALRLSYTNFKVKAKNGAGEVILQPILLSLKLHLLHDTDVNPYFIVGAGFATNELSPAGTPTKYWNDFAAGGGFGLEFFIGKNFSLGAEGRYDYIEPIAGGAAYQLVSAMGLANVYFGKEDHAKVKGDNGAAAAAAEEQRRKAAADQAEKDRLAAQANRTDDAAAQAQAAAQQAALAAQQAVAASSATAASNAAVAAAQKQVEELQAQIARKDIQPIQFATGSDRLLSSSNATLDKVAAIASQYPALKLKVDGHTDSVGEDQKNQQLSQRRADSVESYLVSKGVDAARVTATGYGETHPIASNDTPAGREQNRRVEFKFEQ